MAAHDHHHDAAPLGAALSPETRRRRMRALGAALVLTSTFTVVEVVGGLLTGSLALLADAGHMLSDDLSLGIALFAVWLAGRPATPRRSFGYRRAEVLAALANGVALVAIAIWIVVEAARRLGDPPTVEAGGVLGVGLLGLVVNLVAAGILWRTQGESINVRAAFLHVVADLLGSVGVVVGGAVLLATGWQPVDPLIGIVIAILVVVGAVSVLRESVSVLMETAPRGIDPERIGARMTSAPGVVEVHDLHVWAIAPGFPALSAHVLVPEGDDCHLRRRELERLLADEFGVRHTTLQVDHHLGATRFVPFPPSEG